MNMKHFADKYRCSDVQIKAAVVFLVIRAIKVQSNILKYEFSEDQFLAELRKSAPLPRRMLKLVED